MVAVAAVEWQDMMAGQFPDTPARKAFREAVATVAERAKAALPESHGRIDAAVKLVLAGDVEMRDDGSAEVGSASDAGQGSTGRVSVAITRDLQEANASTASRMAFTTGAVKLRRSGRRYKALSA